MASPRENDRQRAWTALHDSIVFSGQDYDPGQLVRAVNALQALGQVQALDVLSAYAIGKDAESKKFAAGVEPERALVVARLLFVRRPGGNRLPPLALGQTGIALVEALSDWPLAPLIVSRDLPFLLVEAVLLGGLGTSPAQDMLSIEGSGRMRDKPLTPGNPRDAVEALLTSLAWQHGVTAGSKAAARRLVYLQALMAARCLPGAATVRERLRQTDPSRADGVWQQALTTLPWGDLTWSPTSQRYQLAPTARAP